MQGKTVWRVYATLDGQAACYACCECMQVDNVWLEFGYGVAYRLDGIQQIGKTTASLLVDDALAGQFHAFVNTVAE